MSVKARGSITLIRVNDGEDGNDAITVSPTAPSNPVTGQLWQTASGNPIKRWDGSKWVVHYISVENLKTEIENLLNDEKKLKEMSNKSLEIIDDLDICKYYNNLIKIVEE